MAAGSSSTTISDEETTEEITMREPRLPFVPSGTLSADCGTTACRSGTSAESTRCGWWRAAIRQPIQHS